MGIRSIARALGVVGAGLVMCLQAQAQTAGAARLSLAEALRLALNRNPDIRASAEQIGVARGQYLQQRGQFDTLLASGVNYDRSITPYVDTSLPVSAFGQTHLTSTGYRAGVSQLLRNGMSVSGALDAASVDGTAAGAAPGPRQNAVKLDLTLTVPLLNGRGSEVTTAAEEAARLTVLATGYALRDRAALTLYDTMLAYWDYLEKVELERVALSTAERSAALRESTRRLVEASEKPRADLVLLDADYADKQASLEAARLARADAKTDLGRLLGLDVRAIDALGEPADVFPKPLDAPLADVATLSAQAIERRPDMRALALQLDAEQRQVRAAGNARLPVLNLDMGVQYLKVSQGGTRYGFIDAPGRIQSAPTVYARLNFQFPVQNHAADGLLLERSSLLTQLEIRRRDQAIGVASGVGRALRALASNAQQLRSARDSLVLYETAVKQEIVKQRNGISTLIDVINTEARFVSARINLLQVQLAYAKALARLRYETGTLVPAPAGDDSLGNLTLDVAALTGPGPLLAH
ncbi:TolC family protein [Massilia rhizosphaerae]|uniref:TolC family protein n=1 Tax=Massilia rhizosphaerae TaxID=2784389 RepID=UPI0018DDE377|nr:TolC family protein [Massilia rhizosphaerae]